MFSNNFEKLDIPFPGVRLPKVQISDEDYKRYNLSPNISNTEFLKGICRIGYKEKVKSGEINKSRAKEYGERVNEELSLLEELGFIDYILLVWDVINFCRKNNIPVGPGRGSCCGSLVCYLSGITKIDSIKYELYFARFVSRARAKSIIIDGIVYLEGSLLPDIDNDICCYRRSEVIEYLKNKYPNRFCKLSTQMTLSTRVLIKECGKIVENYSDDKMTQVSASIPSLFGKVHDIDKAIEESEKFASFASSNKRILKIAKKLHGLVKHKGSHASAFMISYYDLYEFMPCELGSDGEITSCPDMEYSQIEAVKLDLLGLDSVTLVDSILKRTNVDISKINLDNDCNIYKHLQNFDATYGIFQLSGESVVRAIQKIKPQNILDVSAITSLIRPGASQFIDDYANGVEVPFKNKILKEILKETNGVTLFQEQQLAIANKVFGLELSEAETLRRIIGKKKTSEMAAWKPKIFEQAEKLKLEEGLAEWFWSILQASASYSFNKCLSPDTLIETENQIKSLENVNIGDLVLSYDEKSNENIYVTVLDKTESYQELYCIELENGMSIKCSLEHKFLTEERGMVPIKEIIENNLTIICSKEKEIYRDIIGYEGLYKISNHGNVVSYPRYKRNMVYGGCELSKWIDKDGYSHVTLRKDKAKKRHIIHREVAKCFIENPNNLPCINHKDGNKNNNHISNLEWVSIKDNNLHGYKTGLIKYNTKNLPIYYGENHHATTISESDVLDIKTRYKNGERKSLQEKYNLHYTTIWRIATNRSWKNLK